MTPRHAAAREGALFQCCFCSEPMTLEDFADLKMRPPEPGETADEYRDAELADEFRHLRCESPGRTPA